MLALLLLLVVPLDHVGLLCIKSINLTKESKLAEFVVFSISKIIFFLLRIAAVSFFNTYLSFSWFYSSANSRSICVSFIVYFSIVSVFSSICFCSVRVIFIISESCWPILSRVRFTSFCKFSRRNVLSLRRMFKEVISLRITKKEKRVRRSIVNTQMQMVNQDDSCLAADLLGALLLFLNHLGFSVLFHRLLRGCVDFG